MTLVKFLGVIILAALLLGVHSAKVDICRSTTINILCNADTYKWVQIVSVVEEPCGTTPVCTESQRNDIKAQVITACVNTSSCTIRVPTLCAAQIDYNCIQGEATTPRTVITTPPREDDWVKDFGSWQWAIIWIIIGVVLVAAIILIVMLVNRCCFKMFNQEKPKFVECTPTHSNLGSTLNSRSVSMSTLHRPPPKKAASQEEIDEVRAQFGTARKNKDKNMKHFGAGITTTLDSRRSSGDGASGEPNSRLYQGDDSSSGIGSSMIENRSKNALYTETDTCHDDYLSYTMKKLAKSPLNATNGTLPNSKKVDEDLYRKEAPTVDICEDSREENFRMDINGWTLNKHGQQVPRTDPAGASTVTVDVEAASDIQLNPEDSELWVLHDHQRVKTIKSKRGVRRMTSIISTGSDLGFIPEHGVPTSASVSMADSGYCTLPLKSNAGQNSQDNDNLPKLSPTSSAKELVLDVPRLEDQLILSNSTRTKEFYEAFGTPRSQQEDGSLSSALVRKLSYSYPNIPQASQDGDLSTSTNSKPKYVKKRDTGHHSNISHVLGQSLPLPANCSPEADVWQSSSSVGESGPPRRHSKTRFGNSRVNYLTQLKLGETVRLKQEANKKKLKMDPKGTIHYAYKSDLTLAAR